MLTFPLIYCTAASRVTPGSQDYPITVNDGEQGRPAQGNTVTAAATQNTARRARGRDPYVRGIPIQEPRPAAHQRNYYHRNYDNRYYGNHGNHSGGGAYHHGGGGGGGGDYERQHYQQNYMHGVPGAFHPGYGHCHLCGKYVIDHLALWGCNGLMVSALVSELSSPGLGPD